MIKSPPSQFHTERFQRIGLTGMVWISILGVLLTGCSTSYYRKQADSEIYGIIEQAEKEIFGRSSDFTIETPGSHLTPEEVMAAMIIEERQEPGALVLSIEDALQMAVKNSREYQTEKEQVYLRALTLSGERYEFSPHFFATVPYSFSASPDGSRGSEFRPRLGVSQLLKSGASLSATLAGDFLHYYTGDPNRSLVSSISVNLVQPLLRGAGREIATENLTQAERNVIYAIRTYSQYQRQFEVNIVLDYFQLLQNKDQVRNAYDDYKRRLETIRYTEARGEAGKQSQLEVDEAKTEELSAKNSYITAATTYLNNLDRFKLTLGLPLTTKVSLEDKALEELSTAGLPPLRIDRDQAMRISITNHLELLNDIDRFEDSKRKVKVAADRLKADLNILANVTAESDRPNDYTTFKFDDVRAGAGIDLDLPIDRLRERNDYRSTLIAFESAMRTLGRQLDVKKDDIDRGLRDLERLRRSYYIQANSLEIAQRRVKGEELSLQAGRRTVLNVRNAQDVLVSSQNSLTEALVSHLQARLQLLLDIGVLDTDQPKFWLRGDALLVPLQPLEPDQEKLPAVEDILPPDKMFQL